MKTPNKTLIAAAALLAMTLSSGSVYAEEPVIPNPDEQGTLGIVVPQSLKIDNVVSHPNYNGRQAIQFTLLEPQDVTVTLCQKDGFSETVLFSGMMETGTHYVMLPEKKFPRGEYFCYLKGKETDVKALVLSKPPR